MTTLQECTAKIVAAYLTNNPVPDGGVAEITQAVETALREISVPRERPRTPAGAVPIDQSVRHNELVCLNCGKVGLSLKEHIQRAHGMMPHEYRRYWGLDPDYPLVAPGTSERMKVSARRRMIREVT